MTSQEQLARAARSLLRTILLTAALTACIWGAMVKLHAPTWFAFVLLVAFAALGSYFNFLDDKKHGVPRRAWFKWR